MAILLSSIWPVANLEEFKVHFARWNDNDQPLNVYVRDRQEWQGWQEFRPGRDDFNRPFIFALAQFYHEPDVWLFGGVFRVLVRHGDRYEVELADEGQEFIGRLKLRSPYRNRTTRVNLENQYHHFEVQEILPEPYTGRTFPGFDAIDITFGELETLVKNGRADWRAALESVKGIYLITDTSTGKRYVGSAYGEQGIWSRWSQYVETGHGGNHDLRELVTEPTLVYCRENFRIALLENRSARTPDDLIIARESFWKSLLQTRGQDGLNRN